MYKKLIDEARKIVALSKRREQKYSDTDLSDYYGQKIIDILMKLDFDEVMDLQTVMYLGRDKDYNPDLPQEQIFLEYKKNLESLGKSSKELEVEQMVSKMTLGKYITEGYEILGIKL